MNITKGDFAVVEAAGKKVLIKVKSVDGKTVDGINQTMKRNKEGKYEKRLPLAVKMRDVLVNLGPSPRVGKVYGVKIEPLYQRVTTNTCGDILFFVDMEEKLVDRTKKLLVSCYKELHAKRLGPVPAQIEVRPAEGKYAGYYHFLPRAEEDVLCIKPNFDQMGKEDLRYVIYHEYAHGIWYRFLRPDNVAKWIALYDKHMQPEAADEDSLQEILAEVQSAGSLGDYLREAEDETKQILKSVLKHIRSVHGIDRKHFDKLLRHGHDIEAYWPSYVEFSERSVMVSEYAMKSPEEFFAEAFSFHYTGKKIPKDVKELLVRSLTQLTKGHTNGDEDERTDGEQDED